MTNVAARVIRADGSLFARAFTCKYAGKERFQPNQNHSKIWKCICLGSKILGWQSCCMVGDGRRISTLEDVWIGELPLYRWPTFINISWLPPPSRWLKVNFDGSVHPNIRAGFGCTIRDDRGMLLATRGWHT
ncbi:hypothetical protein KSP40_PGU001494 [Platanthera guangdongensis]|uniref:RNase H type-1 domain-containing protein n=1 Tax=Platanthera guangdongensis TaxID=2320717 RepID=A0ABR2MJ31_9ASPA